MPEHVLEGRTKADQRDHVGDDVQPEKPGISVHRDGMGPSVGQQRPVSAVIQGVGTEGERIAEQVIMVNGIDHQLRDEHRDGRADQKPGHPCGRRRRSLGRIIGENRKRKAFVHTQGRQQKAIFPATIAATREREPDAPRKVAAIGPAHISARATRRSSG